MRSFIPRKSLRKLLARQDFIFDGEMDEDLCDSDRKKMQPIQNNWNSTEKM